MNRILFEHKAPAYTLDPRDARFEHVRGVLRMRPGDCFDVGIINGPSGKARITELGPYAMTIEVEWGQAPEPPPPVTLLVGMCRPAAARRILGTVPTLGVRELVFVPCGRSDPAYARSGLWTRGEFRSRLLEGVEQAFDTYLPPVRLPGSLKEALSGLAPGTIQLALDVYEGTEPLVGREFAADQPVCLAVGPERGWDASDRRLLRESGFTLVSLHKRVLRVETAVTVGLTLVLDRMGALD